MTELRKTESELDEGLRLGPLLWPQKMAAELRRLHEENQALRTALAYTEQDLAYQEAKRLEALRTALAQPEQECIYPECETGIGCDGPCGEKPVDTVNTSQERVDEIEKRRHEVVAWHEPGAYGNVTTHKDWALANGWEPLYKEKKT